MRKLIGVSLLVALSGLLIPAVGRGQTFLGKDAGVLAGLPPNGVMLSADLWALSANADGILDFTVPAATIANVAIAAQRRLVHVIGTTGLSHSDDAVIQSVTSRATVVKSGNMSLGVNLLAALVNAGVGVTQFREVQTDLEEAFMIVAKSSLMSTGM